MKAIVDSSGNHLRDHLSTDIDILGMDILNIPRTKDTEVQAQRFAPQTGNTSYTGELFHTRYTQGKTEPDI